MATPKNTATKADRISYERKGRTFSLVLEGRTTLLVLGVIAMIYMAYVLH